MPHRLARPAVALLTALLLAAGASLANAATLVPGLTATGTIVAGGGFDSWTFTANHHESYVIRVGQTSETGAFSPRIRLYGPGATLLATSTSVTVAEIADTAYATGTYTVQVDNSANTTATGAYVLTLAESGHAPTTASGDEGGPMTNGAMHTGTISLGDLDVWTVSANPGDAIVVRVGEVTGGGGLYPWLRLFSPSGVQLGSTSSPMATEVSATAPAMGTYTIVVGDGNNGLGGAGDYRLTVAESGHDVTVSPADQGGPMTNGAIHAGTIDIGDLDLWTIDANAGDAIVVRMGEVVSGSGLYPWLRLYSPSGVALGNTSSPTATEVAATAPATGRYLVVASDGNNGIGGVGDYRLTAALSGHAVTVSPGDQGGPMTNGAIHTGTIDIGDLDLWTIDASAGDAIVVRMGEVVSGSGLYPWLRLYSPSGVSLGSTSSPMATEVATTAPTSGTYLVVAGDGNNGIGGVGDYRLTAALSGHAVTVSPGDQGGPMTNGAIHTGTIDIGDLDLWTVNVNAGDAIVVRMGEVVSGSGLYPWLRLYSPSGVALGNTSSPMATEVSAMAPATGTYLVVASDGNNGIGGVGDYRLTAALSGHAVTTSPGDQGGPMTNGAVHTGTIDIGDLDLWTVDANAGDAVVVRMGEVVSGSGIYPYLRVFSPSGVLLDYSSSPAATELAITAPATGTYLVVAADGNNGYGGVGDYRLTLAQTGVPCVVSPGDQGGLMANGYAHAGTIDIGDMDLWTVSANAGDAIIARMGEVVSGSGLYPYLRIYSPSGVLLDYASSSAATEVATTAPATGTYLVVAADGNNGFGGSGDYRITLAESGHPAVAGPGDEGGSLDSLSLSGVISVGDLDVWTVTVNAGDPIVLDMTESLSGSSLYPWLRLFSPSGVQLSSISGAASAHIAYVAPAPGTYMVVAADGNNGYGGSGAYGLAPSPYADAGPARTFDFRLAPAAPNPFVASTVIRFTTARPGAARLELFDAQGRVVRTLVDGAEMAAGEHAALWDGRNTAGAAAEPGLYLARLQAGGRAFVQKVTLAR